MYKIFLSMIKKYTLHIGSLLLTSICLFNFEANAGINKKDFKSKTVSQLIDVLNDDELLEKKVMEKIDKKFMCKLNLASFPASVKIYKENLENTAKALAGSPPEFMQESIRQTEKITIDQLKLIDKYCP